MIATGVLKKRDGAPPFFTGQTAIFQGFQQKVFETALLFLIAVGIKKHLPLHALLKYLYLLFK